MPQNNNHTRVKIKDVIATLERFAPLPLQDSFDNAGLQIGQTGAEVSGVLLCLDVTEAVLQEAKNCGANLVVAHHPLLFHGLKCIAGRNMVERITATAIKNDIAIYAAHTNLDNARGGVNYKIAEKLGAQVTSFLMPKDENSGSGVIAEMETPMGITEFLSSVKRIFGVDCVMHNDFVRSKTISKIAICGGAGAFLLQNAIDADCDAFLTGEMHYHDYFGHENDLLVTVIGHYQSEKFTTEIFRDLLKKDFPALRIETTQLDTNPIKYF